MNNKTVIKLFIAFILIVVVSFLSLDFIFRAQIGENIKHKNDIEQKSFEDENVDYDTVSIDNKPIKDNIDGKDNSSNSTEVKNKKSTLGANTNNNKNNDKNNDSIIKNSDNKNILAYGSIIKNELQEEKNILGKDIYNKNDLKIAIRGALRNFKENLNVDIYNISQADYKNAITEVLNEYCEIDYGYLDTSYVFTDYNNGKASINYKFNYRLDRSTLIAQRDKTNNIVKNIIDKNIKTNMSKLQKEIFFHDYIVNNAYYNKYYIDRGILHPSDYTAYGILAEGKGVCEGYSKAFNLLCKSADITCIMVKGNANGPHAWNMVKLDDNQWYNVDVTWDDPIISNKNELLVKTNHNYFNIPTEEINKNHTIRAGYPIANGQRYLRDNIDIKEYDMEGNLFIKVTNVNEFKAIVKTKLLNKSTVVTCKLNTFTLDQNSIFNVVKNIARENSVKISTISLLLDGAPIKYLKIKIQY